MNWSVDRRSGPCGMSWRMWLVVATAVALLIQPTVAATAALPSVASGPRPGPDILYSPRVDAPQLQNTGVWKAAPILVSGASAYRDGEFLYQDYLYDDHGARALPDLHDAWTAASALSRPYGTYTYPTDPRYAGNAADLVELRVRPTLTGTAIRLTLNSMTDPSLVGASVAIGNSAAPRAFPHGAGVVAPAALFLTWHGSTAELIDARTGRLAGRPTATVDLHRRQVTLAIPSSAWNPGHSVVRLAAGVGLWDRANGRYLVPQAVADATHPGGGGAPGPHAALFNVAFRYTEPLHPGTTKVTDPAMWRDNAQGRALAAGDISALHADVDFGELSRRVDDDMIGRFGGIPASGPINRILASAYEPAQGLNPSVVCAGALVVAARCTGQLTGRLQPYSLYLPRKSPPAKGYGLTLLLHAFTENHNEYSGLRYQSQFGETGGGSLVLTPEARGTDGFYYSYALADTFEAWADVARHYRVDSARAVIAGYSMGAVGVWRIAGQFPDLFARMQPSTSGPNATQVQNLRNVPLMVWLAGQDELQTQNLWLPTELQLDGLGYRFQRWLFEPADHLTLHFNDQWAPAAAFLADSYVDRSPPHVTYVYNPAVDFPGLGIRADHAYWLSQIALRQNTPTASTGSLDVRSEGFGLADPVAQSFSDAGTLNGGLLPALPYQRVGYTWAPAAPAPRADRLTITATNVSTVTIDPVRARVSCAPELTVTTDGPLTVHLSGCPNATRNFNSSATANGP